MDVTDRVASHCSSGVIPVPDFSRQQKTKTGRGASTRIGAKSAERGILSIVRIVRSQVASGWICRVLDTDLSGRVSGFSAYPTTTPLLKSQL
jgi:hypothetical protein